MLAAELHAAVPMAKLQAELPTAVLTAELPMAELNAEELQTAELTAVLHAAMLTAEPEATAARGGADGGGGAARADGSRRQAMGSDDVHSKFLSPTISKLLLIVSNRATKVWGLLPQVRIIQIESISNHDIARVPL